MDGEHIDVLSSAYFTVLSCTFHAQTIDFSIFKFPKLNDRTTYLACHILAFSKDFHYLSTLIG